MGSRGKIILNLLKENHNEAKMSYCPSTRQNAGKSLESEEMQDDSSEALSLPEDVQNELRSVMGSDDDSVLDLDFNVDSDNTDDDDNHRSTKRQKGRHSDEEQEETQHVESDLMEPQDESNKIRLKTDTRKIREERAIKRNTAKEYISRKNKVVRGRSLKTLSMCRNKCVDKFTDEVRLNLFNDFWAMGNYNRRTQYISGLIDLHEKKTSKVRKTDNHHLRTITAIYNFRINGTLSRTCKECFRRTFDVSNKFIEILIGKMKISNVAGVIQLDQRGSHTSRRKISDEDKEVARNHILSIPSYESHYTRRRTSKRYIPAHYSLSSLYQAYRDQLPENIINRKAYEEIFHSLNIKIKEPKKDTCCTCDKLVMKIKMAKFTEEKEIVKSELASHHLKADEGYTSKEIDRNSSKINSEKKTICFDLQQCLPTPDLQSGESFYKRQLWTYNLTVHDCDDAQAYCYIWYESLAKRGGNDIVSCVYKYLTKQLDSGVNHITMYSDSCGGQNKNSILSAACLVALQNSENLCIIDHKFLLPGHTHMECDTDHSLIEKKKKKCNLKVEHPHDWAQLIRQVGKKKPFFVNEMERLDFFDFAGLFGSNLTNRKKDISGEKLNWREVRWLRYEKNSKNILFKTSLNENENFKSVSFEKRGTCNKELVPKCAYSIPVAITVEKKQHLMDLLPYISESLWDFYKNIPTNTTVVDVLSYSSSDKEA